MKSQARMPWTLMMGTAAIALGCASASESDSGWSCTETDVPMGTALECVSTNVSSALTYEEYDCVPRSSTDDLCPPPGSSGTRDGVSGTTGSNGGSSSDGSGASGEGSMGGDRAAGGSGDGTTTGGDGSMGGGSSTGGGSTSDGVPSECRYVPDLSYCGDADDGSQGHGNGNGNSGNGRGNGNGNNGNGNDDGNGNGNNGNGNNGNGSGKDGAPGTDDPAPTRGPSGKSDGTGGYHCVVANGKRTCREKRPSCAPGTRPAACGACVPVDAPDTEDCTPPSAGGCWFTGGGFIVAPSIVPNAPADGHDNYGGNAKPMKDGRIQGQWNHVDHGTGNHAHGQPEYIVCRHVDEPGPGQPGGKKGFDINQVYFGGPARWRTQGTWEEGYWFDVFAEDHGEPGNKPGPAKHGGRGPDFYRFTLRKQADAASQRSGTVVYDVEGDVVGGNLQLHPPNNGHPATPGELPPWVAFQ